MPTAFCGLMNAWIPARTAGATAVKMLGTALKTGKITARTVATALVMAQSAVWTAGRINVRIAATAPETVGTTAQTASTIASKTSQRIQADCRTKGLLETC